MENEEEVEGTSIYTYAARVEVLAELSAVAIGGDVAAPDMAVTVSFPITGEVEAGDVEAVEAHARSAARNDVDESADTLSVPVDVAALLRAGYVFNGRYAVSETAVVEFDDLRMAATSI